MKKAIRKTKRKATQVWREQKLVVLLLALIVLIAIGVTFFQTIEPEPIQKNTAAYELTETDIFSLEGVHATEISVLGLQLGQRVEEMLATLGNPDIQREHPNSITTFEYGSALDLNKTGLIISTKNGFVTSITVKEPFNELLKGKTKVGYEKEDIYRMFGAPDRTSFIPVTANSAKVMRVLEYQDRGLEFSLVKAKDIGFSLVIESTVPESS